MDGLFLTSCRHWWEQLNSTVIEFHLSETSGSRRAQTRIAHLVDRDANDCAISPPLRMLVKRKQQISSKSGVCINTVGDLSATEDISSSRWVYVCNIRFHRVPSSFYTIQDDLILISNAK